TLSRSSGSLPMSVRNGSASDADCQISEDCSVPDVELIELGPLLEEGGGRLGSSKGVHPEVGPLVSLPLVQENVWEGRWRVIPFHVLPDWLKDNDYLLHGHRPPMPSFRACFGSIFRIHTETGNIWTHLLDYSGIALLIMGSFVPWLYYSFYCSPQPRLIYLTIVCVLGIAAIIVAQWDRFATPRHRPTRAGVFMGLGLSGIVPTMHFTIEEGFVKATTVGQMGWFYLMGAMYITGAGLYAARIPERFFPGKCDIWIFHVLVVAAAFIHFYGVSNLQEFRYGLEGGCTDDSLL
ncbi:Adiponectin receptor protein 1, partial [Goodea atripinnis]